MIWKWLNILSKKAYIFTYILNWIQVSYKLSQIETQ